MHLATLLPRVATCCDMLGVVGSNLKMVKSFMQRLRMLHGIVVVWSGRSQSRSQSLGTRCAQACALVRYRHVSTRRNGVAKLA